jgi:hypothetical protein
MKTPSRPNHHKLAITLACHFPEYRKNQLEVLVLMVYALIKAQSVKHSKLAERFPGEAKHSSVVRRIERFFVSFPIVQADVAPLVLACLPSKDKLTFILDRSNWELGQTPINALVLSVVYENIAIPLLWEFLDHKGCSNQDNRIDLMGDLLSLLQVKRIGQVLADREFIGQDWFEFLIKQSIGLCIRLRDNSYTSLGEVQICFEELTSGAKLVVYGVSLNIMATLSPTSERVVVASTLTLSRILKLYKLRFRIECMFRFLKSKGFRWEDTHMTCPERLDRLLCLLVIAYVWCVLIGLEQTIRTNKYGRLVRARFSQGLSLLTRAFYQKAKVLHSFTKTLLDAFSGANLHAVGY